MVRNLSCPAVSHWGNHKQRNIRSQIFGLHNYGRPYLRCGFVHMLFQNKITYLYYMYTIYYNLHRAYDTASQLFAGVRTFKYSALITNDNRNIHKLLSAWSIKFTQPICDRNASLFQGWTGHLPNRAFSQGALGSAVVLCLFLCFFLRDRPTV